MKKNRYLDIIYSIECAKYSGLIVSGFNFTPLKCVLGDTINEYNRYIISKKTTF